MHSRGDVRGHQGWGTFPLSYFPFWRQGRTIASFPLNLALTPGVACNDPVLGSHIQSLVKSGQVDPGTALILFLMFQKLLGDGSAWAPWLALVPKKHKVPLNCSDDELEELAGTPLHHAATIQQNMLKSLWATIEAPCQRICKEVCSVQKTLAGGRC